MLIDIDTNDKYFLEEYSSYAGGMADTHTSAKVVGVSEIEGKIKVWYSDYTSGEDIHSGYDSPESFIEELLQTGRATVCASNLGGSYDDASSFGLVVTELTLYKERELNALQAQIEELKALTL